MARPKKRRDRDELPPGCRWKRNAVEFRRMRAGKTEQRQFGTPSEAWEFVRDLEAVERSTALGIVAKTNAPRDVTVGDICDWYQREHLNSTRLRARSRRLDAAIEALGSKRLAALSTTDVADWINALAASPVTRRLSDGTLRLVHVTTTDEKTGEKTREPKRRGPKNLASYLSELSSALTWHARDHGYAAGYENVALQAAPGLRRRGTIGKSGKRKRRINEDEEARLIAAAREYVESGAATLVTRRRTRRRWDIGLALELARFAPVTGRRITELSRADVTLDAAGRAVAIRLLEAGGPVRIPRRVGRELEALLKMLDGDRLFPVGRQEPPKALNRLARALKLPGLLWPGLSAWTDSESAWKRLVFESRRDRDEFMLIGRQRMELPIAEFYQFMLIQGFRPGEVPQLLWRDIRLAPRPRIHLVHDPAQGRYLKGKDEDDRWVPIRVEALAVLDSLTTDRSPDAPIFGASYATFYQRHKRVRAMIGSDTLTLHSFRHEALSRMGELGFNLTDLQVFSGHSDLRELNTYVHGSAESVEAKLDRIDGPRAASA